MTGSGWRLSRYPLHSVQCTALHSVKRNTRGLLASAPEAQKYKDAKYRRGLFILGQYMKAHDSALLLGIVEDLRGEYSRAQDSGM